MPCLNLFAGVAQYRPEEFTYSLGGPEPDELVDGFQYRGVNVNQLPSLHGYGVSMALLNLDACAINLPHLHPRATEVILNTCRLLYLTDLL